MIKYLFTMTATIFFYVISIGQNSSYRQLIDSSTKCAGLFIGIEPVKNLQLDMSDTSFYKEHLEEVSNYKIDSKILIELIQNSKSIDTSYWSDEELNKSVLIKSRDEYVNLKAVLFKFKIAGKGEIKFYRKQINEFNNTSSWDKNIFYFSRPVFDNIKTFAVVYYSNGHSGLSGGGSVALFHFDANTWKEIGDITHWRY